MRNQHRSTNQSRAISFLLALLLLCPLAFSLPGVPATAAGSVSLSATINGSSSYRLASNPAISGDGSTIIYGQPGHWAGWAIRHRATVLVKEWNGSSWVSKGSLPDAANRQIGFWHDVSDDGDVVSHSSSATDEVYIFDWDGSSWKPRPTVTASQAGVSITRHALSGDGSVLVVGERGYDEDGETNNGKVRTLDWNGSAWNDRTPFVGTDGELIGASRMDLTADGLTISFSGSGYDTEESVDIGRVRVASWNGSSWSERPQIVGSEADAGVGSAVLSDDGMTLALSEGKFRETGRIRTFDWVNTSWIERPTAGEDAGKRWIDLDMSSDGQTFSVSDNDRQLLRVYDWVGDSWAQRGSDAPSFNPRGGGHYGNVASITSDGFMVATSQVYSDVAGWRSGRIDIYSSTTAQRGVVFAANEGEGTMSTQVALSAANLEANAFTREGCTFGGWNTVASGEGVAYADQASYPFTTSDTLYAQWESCPTSGSGPSDSSKDTEDEVARVSKPPSNPIESPNRGVRIAPPQPNLPGAPATPRKIRAENQGFDGSKAIGLIGGVKQEVISSVIGERDASFAVGQVSFDLGIDASKGEVQDQSGTPALKILRDTGANLRGSGLLPNSTLTLFMPGPDDAFKEFSKLKVSDDGSFAESISFRASADGRPIPIGNHFVQMLGADPDGSEFVLDIPVTVAQPLPSPELDRGSGEIPTLVPGESLALSAGTQEPMEVNQTGNGLTLSGDNWEFLVSTEEEGSSGAGLTLRRDTPAVINGAGFMPGTRADVWLFSTPTLLGSVDIADDGTFEASFAVDSNFVAPGAHTLQLQGVGPDGFVRAANVGVTVADEEPTLVPPPPTNPLNLLPLLWIVLAALFAMLLLFAITASFRRTAGARGVIRPASAE